MRRYVPVEESSGEPEMWEDDVIEFQLDNIEIAFSNAPEKSNMGVLYITKKRVLWLGKGDSELAYDFDVPYIVLHALTRDVDSYPKPCVYCQLDEEYNDNDDEGELDITDEMYLVPQDEADLLSVFDALSHAAMINPDPEDEDEDSDDGFIFNEEEVQRGADEHAQATLNQLESVFNVPDEFVQDGDEGEGEEDENQ